MNNASLLEGFGNGTPTIPLYHAVPFGDAEIVIAAVLLIPLCIFGIVANLITITTIVHSRKLTSHFYHLILSLSVSDLLSAIISPFALNRLTWGYEVWQWPDIFCKLFWAIDIWTSYVTSIHILYFSALRFYSIQCPFHFKTFTAFRAKIFIAVAWIITFGTGFFPTVLWYGGAVRNRALSALQLPSCSLVMIERFNEVRTYREIAYPLFFLTPFVMVAALSLAVAIKIVLARRKRMQLKGGSKTPVNAKQRRQEIQRFVQLGLIVGSFMLGYIPRAAYHFYSSNRINNPGQEAYNWWFAFMEYLLLRISECLNPVFYNLSSSKMRKETIATMKIIWRKIQFQRKEDDLNTTASETLRTE